VKFEGLERIVEVQKQNNKLGIAENVRTSEALHHFLS
jgi:hypothetical protein